MSFKPHILEPLVVRLQRWKLLNKDDREALLALPFIERAMEAGHYVVRQGDEPQRSCFLLSGLAMRHKEAPDGRRQIMSIHVPGDLVDLHNSLLGHADHNVQMLSDGNVALIPVAAIRKVATDHPLVGMAMWHETLVDGSIFREWIFNVGRRDARSRIAHLLCEFALRLEDAGLGGRSGYVLPMTQEQLADATGLTAVHVNRTLSRLDDEDLIDRTRRSVTITDWEKLANVGDFNSAYLHRNHAPS
ncbi:MAG TPA: Crp/Fnr family transcriptional regulator [Acidobacteriaceae bacterium]|nr:Crp/Fnr family transcriptional regulator [Acidobacteriaceae bacterium]